MHSILFPLGDVGEDLADRIDLLEHVFENPVVPTALERSKGISIEI
jgi:hypothetical protein